MATYENYLAMQKEFYERDIPSKEIVGGYEWNETFPYETYLLYRNGDVRFPIFEDPSKLEALDFACGPGRMVMRMNPIFKRCDGADISSRLIDEAQQNCPGSRFYVTNGDDLGDAPDASYDFVFSTIAMQHIAVHSVKMNILKHMHRILRPGGCLTLQLSFNRHFPFGKLLGESQIGENNKVVLLGRMPNHVHWREDNVNATQTNSSADGAIGAGDLNHVVEDFSKLFEGVDYWFCDHTHFRRQPNTLGMYGNWNTHFIFIHARKAS